MDNLEKLIFLEITNKQLTKALDANYYKTLKLLSEIEKDEFDELVKEIDEIWDNLNTPKNFTVFFKVYKSFDDYKNEIIVSPRIIKVMNDFNLDLKDKISEQSKKLIITKMGKDFFDQNFDNQ